MVLLAGAILLVVRASGYTFDNQNGSEEASSRESFGVAQDAQHTATAMVDEDFIAGQGVNGGGKQRRSFGLCGFQYQRAARSNP